MTEGFSGALSERPSRGPPSSVSRSNTKSATAASTRSSNILLITEGESQTRILIAAWATTKNTTKGTAIHKSVLKENAEIIKALDNLKGCIRLCENERNPDRQQKLFDDLRDHVPKAEFFEVNKLVLVHKHMRDNGLGNIFAPTTGVDFPWGLRADALQLFQCWTEKNFGVELLRGIIKSKCKDYNRSADRIDPVWREQYPHAANYYGQGDLVLGQWWPTQLCTGRDGAHGSRQGGIYGEKIKGAYSIIISRSA